MKKILLIISILFISFNLKANLNNLYLGAGLGFFIGDFDITIKERNVSHNEVQLNNNIDFFLGYNLHQYVALELGYQHFLDNTHKGRDVNGNNLYINSVFKYQIEKHIPFFSFGIGQTKINSTISNNNLNQNRKGLNYMLGIGYEYAITNNHLVGAKYIYNMLPSVDYTDNRETIKKWEKMTYTNLGLYYKYNF